MKHIKTILVFVLCVLGMQAQETESQTKFKGFVDSYHALRMSSPNDWMSSRTRFRGEFTQQYGQSMAFVSFNLNYNPIYKSSKIFELREAYIDHQEKHWGLRMGKQLVVWGVADALRITDLVSPMDMSEFLARDYDDIRMPVNAIRIFSFIENMKAEFIVVPTFQGYVIPFTPDNPWSVNIPSSIPKFHPLMPEIPIEMKSANEPAFKLKNIDFGGRLSFTLPGIDFSVSTLYTWNKIPTMDYMLDIQAISTSAVTKAKMDIIPIYHRMAFVGGDFSKPIGEFVLRGELAYNINKHFSADIQKNLLTKKRLKYELIRGNMQIRSSSTACNSLNWLLGVDWYAGDDWMLSAQFSSESIFKYKSYLEADRNTALATLNVSKEVLNNSLKLSAFSYFDLKHKGLFSRISADYSLSDQIRLIGGLDLFHSGDDKGIFEIYKDNSEFWIKAKYSF